MDGICEKSPSGSWVEEVDRNAKNWRGWGEGEGREDKDNRGIEEGLG